jgi:serine/threonine protein kinase
VLFDYSGFTKFVRFPDDPRPTEEELKEIVKGQALALYSLHQMGFVHGDVKPDNFLFFEKQRIWKLCDFGLSFPVS